MSVAANPTAANRHLTTRLFAKYAVISLLPVGLLGLIFAVSLALGLALLYLTLLATTLLVGRGLHRQAALNALQAEQLRTSALEHRLLFEENPQPLFAFDRQTLEIVAVSNASVEHYGYSREELLTMRIADLHVPEDAEAVRTLLEALGRNEPSGLHSIRQTRYRHQYKDGTIIDVDISGDNVMLGGRDCRIALCLNVTARTRAIAELAVARDEAIAASNTKSAFLANMSHEIRTPMNGVIGMTELLADSGLNEEQESYAEHIVRSGERMLAIVNDILDISKIETGQLDLDLTDFALRETIEQACAIAAVQAASKGVGLAVEFADATPHNLRGDAGRLSQIVLNLVANAVKFTDEGAVTVRVAAPRSGPDGTQVRVEVEDTGIGIDPGTLERLFEPFVQADASTTRNYGGTGLGLAIARELTQLMGGTIGAASSPGHGSTFWFEVRLEAAISEEGPLPAPRPVRAPVVALGPDAPLVLVADDTPVNQIVAVRALQRCGCRSHVVNDGYEVLEALLTQRYAAILMDCEMPEMDGYETAGELRQREVGGHRTPVIAMTAHAMKGDLEKCLAAGMDDYVSKPLRHQALREVLERWIPELAESADAVDDVEPDAEQRPPVAVDTPVVDATSAAA
jgi:PAS domain S-box-containing protein